MGVRYVKSEYDGAEKEEMNNDTLRYPRPRDHGFYGPLEGHDEQKIVGPPLATLAFILDLVFAPRNHFYQV
jgi:hypothetical protein